MSRKKSALNSPDMFIGVKGGQSSFTKFVCPFVELDTESRKESTDTVRWRQKLLCGSSSFSQWASRET